MNQIKICATCRYSLSSPRDVPCRDCRNTHSPDESAGYDFLWRPHDGCVNCRYECKSGTVEPCISCRGTNETNIIDHWEPAKGSRNFSESPTHYADNCSLECIDVMKLILGVDGYAYFCLGNIFKYLWRYKYKNGPEDLKKCETYIQMLHDTHIENYQKDILKQLTTLFDKIKKEAMNEG